MSIQASEQDRSEAFELLTLADGRKLAWLEWGDPNGFPVFYFHGTPSSRLEAAFADAAARKYRIRLIASDRPGFGRSSFQPDRQFRHWPEDIDQLARHLGIDAFGVAGHSGAGPHLFACGAVFEPGRLRFIGALAPWGPVAAPEILQSLNRVDRFYLKLARQAPWLMRAAFAPLGWSARYWPSLFFRIMQASVSEPDRIAMNDPALMQTFHRIEREAFHQGSRGPAYEAALAYRTWDIDIAGIQVPTTIWLGAEDVFVPQTMGRYFERMIPDLDLHILPGEGHFNVHRWDDIFRACLEYIS